MLSVVAMAEDYQRGWATTTSLDKMKQHHSFASSRADRSRYSHQNNLLLVNNICSSKSSSVGVSSIVAASTTTKREQQGSQNLANLVDVMIVDDGELSNSSDLRKFENGHVLPESVDNCLSDVPFGEKDNSLTGKSGQGSSEQHDTSLLDYALSLTSVIRNGVDKPIINRQQIPFLESHSLDESSRSANIELQAKEAQTASSPLADSLKHSELSDDPESVKKTDMFPYSGYPNYPYVHGYSPVVPPVCTVPPVYNPGGFIPNPGSYQPNPYMHNNGYVDPRYLQYSTYNQYPPPNHLPSVHQTVHSANISVTVSDESVQLNHIHSLSPTQFHPGHVPSFPGQIEVTEKSNFAQSSLTFSILQNHQQTDNLETVVQKYPDQISSDSNFMVPATPTSPPSDSTPDLNVWHPNPCGLITVSPSYKDLDVNRNEENVKSNHGKPVDSNEHDTLTSFTSSREEKQTLRKQKGMSRGGDSSDDEDGLINMMKKIQKKLPPKESRTSSREKSALRTETLGKSSETSDEKVDNDDKLTEEQKMFWAKLLSKPKRPSQPKKETHALDSPLSPERNDSNAVELPGLRLQKIDVTVDKSYIPPNYQELRQDPRIIKRAEKLGLPLSGYNSSDLRPSEEIEAFSSTEDDDVEKMLMINELQEEDKNIIPVDKTVGDDLFPPVEGTFLPNYEPNSTDLQNVILDPEESIDILDIVEAQFRKAQQKEALKDRQLKEGNQERREFGEYIKNGIPKESKKELTASEESKRSSSSESTSRASSISNGYISSKSEVSHKSKKQTKVEKVCVGGSSTDRKTIAKRKHQSDDVGGKKTSSIEDQPPVKKHHHNKTTPKDAGHLKLKVNTKPSSKREDKAVHVHEKTKLKSVPTTKEHSKSCKSKSIRKKSEGSSKNGTERHSDKNKWDSKDNHRIHNRDSSSSRSRTSELSLTSNGSINHLELEDVSSASLDSCFDEHSTPPRKGPPKSEDPKLDAEKHAKKTESKNARGAISFSSSDEDTSATNGKTKKSKELHKEIKKKRPKDRRESHKKMNSSSSSHSDSKNANAHQKQEEKVTELLQKFVPLKNHLKDEQKSTGGVKRVSSLSKKDAQIAEKKLKLSAETYDSEDDFEPRPAKKTIVRKSSDFDDDTDCLILSDEETIVFSQQCVPSEETIVEKKRSESGDAHPAGSSQVNHPTHTKGEMNESDKDPGIHPAREIAVTDAVSEMTVDANAITPHNTTETATEEDEPYRAYKVKVVKNESLRRVFAAMDPTSSPFL